MYDQVISDGACHHIDIMSIFKIDCNMQCDDGGIDYNIYNKILQYGDITSKNEGASLVCDTYFCDTNDTSNSLNSMDSILEIVLLWISNEDPYTVNEIIKSPITVLKNVGCNGNFSDLQYLHFDPCNEK